MTRTQRVAASIAWQLGLGCLFVVLIFATHDAAQSARAADAANGSEPVSIWYKVTPQE